MKDFHFHRNLSGFEEKQQRVNCDRRFDPYVSGNTTKFNKNLSFVFLTNKRFLLQTADAMTMKLRIRLSYHSSFLQNRIFNDTN